MKDGNTNTSYEWAETIRMAIEALEKEPCDDCISRHELLFQLNCWISSGAADSARSNYDLISRMSELPSVQPTRPKGKWIDDCGKFYCSECKAEYDEIYETHSHTYYSKFCPNCGADMRGDKK